MEPNTATEIQKMPAFLKNAHPSSAIPAPVEMQETPEDIPAISENTAISDYNELAQLTSKEHPAIAAVPPTKDDEQRKGLAEIKSMVKKLTEESLSLEKKTERNKDKYFSSKDEQNNAVLKLIVLMYNQHKLYLASPPIQDGKYNYESPLKEEVARTTKNGKRRKKSDNPFIGIVKLFLEDCPAKNVQAAWTSNNKYANALYFVDKKRDGWSAPIEQELKKLGGRDKLAALGAKLRKEEHTGEKVISASADELCKKRIESLIASCPTISANQLAAGDAPGFDGLSIAFVRHIEGEAACLIPLPSACSVAANKAMARILAKVGGTHEKA